jgi:hypothetical protein
MLKEFKIWDRSVKKNENIEGNVYTLDTHEGGNREMVEKKGARVCATR